MVVVVVAVVLVMRWSSHGQGYKVTGPCEMLMQKDKIQD